MGVHPFILTPMDPSADGARTSRAVEKNGFSMLFALSNALATVLGTSLPPVGTHIGLASYSTSVRRGGARRPLLDIAGGKQRLAAAAKRPPRALTAKEMVQVTSALLAIAAAAAGLAGVATETRAPTLARTLAYFKPAAADEAAAPPPALSKLTQAVTPAPKEVPASKEEPSAVEAYLERAKAFAVEHGKVLGGTLLALVAAVLALGGKKKAETNGSRVAAPVAPVEVTTCVEIKFRAPHAIDAMVSP